MTKSRGIGRGRQPTHGHSRRPLPSPTYNSWRGMIERCRPDKQYGKVGVTVCERWRVFENFLTDMGERPEGCEIDRINPYGPYQPSNCRWTPMRANRQYRRTTVLTEEKRDLVRSLRKDGKSHREIARQLGVSKSCVTEFLRGAAWL